MIKYHLFGFEKGQLMEKYDGIVEGLEEYTIELLEDELGVCKILHQFRQDEAEI